MAHFVLNNISRESIGYASEEDAKQAVRQKNQETQEYHDTLVLASKLIAGGFEEEEEFRCFLDNFCFSDDSFFANKRIFSYILVPDQ